MVSHETLTRTLPYPTIILSKRKPGRSAAAQVWFEVSAHTGRAHFHAAADGSAPLGLSLPLELLQLAAQPPLPAALAQLLDALDARCAERAEGLPRLGGSSSRPRACPGAHAQCTGAAAPCGLGARCQEPGERRTGRERRCLAADEQRLMVRVSCRVATPWALHAVAPCPAGARAAARTWARRACWRWALT